jgi:hypothetical protein
MYSTILEPNVSENSSSTLVTIFLSKYICLILFITRFQTSYIYTVAHYNKGFRRAEMSIAVENFPLPHHDDKCFIIRENEQQTIRSKKLTLEFIT